MRLLDKFEILLLDMCGTFMFEQDRFGEKEDFYSTYLSVGGNRLAPSEVAASLRACYAGMNRDYADPQRYDDFPSLTEGFQRYAPGPEDELLKLERVFELHERGTIPEWSASLLRRLASTHRLALVSNIWSRRQVWLEEFKRVGIERVFHHAVFSSDYRSIKPSPVLFREALRGMKAKPHEALFIGDSLRYDMEGAQHVGLATAWITSDPKPHLSVDYTLSSLHEIETHNGDRTTSNLLGGDTV